MPNNPLQDVDPNLISGRNSRQSNASALTKDSRKPPSSVGDSLPSASGIRSMLKTDTEVGDIGLFMPKQRQQKYPTRTPAPTAMPRALGGVSRTSSHLSRFSGRTPSLRSKGSNYSLQSTISRQQSHRDWVPPSPRTLPPSRSRFEPSSVRYGPTAEEEMQRLGEALRARKQQEDEANRNRVRNQQLAAVSARAKHQKFGSLSTFRSNGSVRSTSNLPASRPRSPKGPRLPLAYRRSPPPTIEYPPSPKSNFESSHTLQSEFSLTNDETEPQGRPKLQRPAIRSYHSQPTSSYSQDPSLQQPRAYHRAVTNFSNRDLAELGVEPSRSGFRDQTSRHLLLDAETLNTGRRLPEDKTLSSGNVDGSGSITFSQRALLNLQPQTRNNGPAIDYNIASDHWNHSHATHPVTNNPSHDHVNERIASTSAEELQSTAILSRDAAVYGNTLGTQSPSEPLGSAISTPSTVAGPYRQLVAEHNRVLQVRDQFEARATATAKSNLRAYQNAVSPIHPDEPVESTGWQKRQEPQDHEPLSSPSLYSLAQETPATKPQNDIYVDSTNLDNTLHQDRQVLVPLPTTAGVSDSVALPEYGATPHVDLQSNAAVIDPGKSSNVDLFTSKHVPSPAGTSAHETLPMSSSMKFDERATKDTADIACGPESLFDDSKNAQATLTPQPDDPRLDDPPNISCTSDAAIDPNDLGDLQETSKLSPRSLRSVDLRSLDTLTSADAQNGRNAVEDDVRDSFSDLESASDDGSAALDANQEESQSENSLSGSPGPTRSISCSPPKGENREHMLRQEADANDDLAVQNVKMHEESASLQSCVEALDTRMIDSSGQQDGGEQNLTTALGSNTSSRDSSGSSILAYRPESREYRFQHTSMTSIGVPKAHPFENAKSRSRYSSINEIIYSNSGLGSKTDEQNTSLNRELTISFPKFSSRPVSTESTVYEEERHSLNAGIAGDARSSRSRVNRYGLQDLTEDSGDTSTTNVRRLRPPGLRSKATTSAQADVASAATSDAHPPISGEEGKVATPVTSYLEPNRLSRGPFMIPSLKFSGHDLTTSLNRSLQRESSHSEQFASSSFICNSSDVRRPRSSTVPGFLPGHRGINSQRYESRFEQPEESEDTFPESAQRHAETQSLKEHMMHGAARSTSTVDAAIIEEVSSLPVPHADDVLINFKRQLWKVMSESATMREVRALSDHGLNRNNCLLDSSPADLLLSRSGSVLDSQDTSSDDIMETFDVFKTSKAAHKPSISRILAGRNIDKALPPLPTGKVPLLPPSGLAPPYSTPTADNAISSTDLLRRGKASERPIYEAFRKLSKSEDGIEQPEPGQALPQLRVTSSRDIFDITETSVPWNKTENFTFIGGTPTFVLQPARGRTPVSAGKHRLNIRSDDIDTAGPSMIAGTMSPGSHGRDLVSSSTEEASLMDSASTTRNDKSGIFAPVTKRLRRKFRTTNDGFAINTGMLHPEIAPVTPGERYPTTSLGSHLGIDNFDRRSVYSQDSDGLQLRPKRRSLRKRLTQLRAARPSDSKVYSSSATQSEPHGINLARRVPDTTGSLPRTRSDSNLDVLIDTSPAGMGRGEYHRKQLLKTLRNFLEGIFRFRKRRH